MIVEPVKLDATQYAVQYELVRAQVIGSAGNLTRDTAVQTRGVGLALLLSEGMPGWLKTVEAVFRAQLVSRAADCPDHSLYELAPQNNAVSVWLPSVQRHELAALLASLVLSTRPVASREGYH